LYLLVLLDCDSSPRTPNRYIDRDTASTKDCPTPDGKCDENPAKLGTPVRVLHSRAEQEPTADSSSYSPANETVDLRDANYYAPYVTMVFSDCEEKSTPRPRLKLWLWIGLACTFPVCLKPYDRPSESPFVLVLSLTVQYPLPRDTTDTTCRGQRQKLILQQTGCVGYSVDGLIAVEQYPKRLYCLARITVATGLEVNINP
jgi:hypothetical protein